MTNKTIDAIKKVGNAVYKTGKCTAIAITLPFAVPTYIRKFEQNKLKEDMSFLVGHSETATYVDYIEANALFLGAIELGATGYFLDGDVAAGLFFAMLATNPFSEGCELVKEKYEEMKYKKEMKAKDLESKVKNNSQNHSSNIY